MGTYKKINGQAVPVTTEGHPQYYFQTKAQAQAALPSLEVGADVFVEEGGNEDVLPRVQELEEDVSEINTSLTHNYYSWSEANSSGQFSYDSYNKLVTFTVNVFGTGVSNGQKIATLVSELRPNTDLTFATCGKQNDGNFHWLYVLVYANGDVAVASSDLNADITNCSYTGIYKIN